jgi:hypothetical protein
MKPLSLLVIMALSGCAAAAVSSGTSEGVTVQLDLSIGSYDEADAVARDHCARFGKRAERLYAANPAGGEPNILVMTNVFYDCI